MHRLPAHPPVGKTALTGYTATGSITGPSVAGLTTKRLLQFRDPVYPLWVDYETSAVPAVAFAATYQTDLVCTAGSPVNPYNAQIEDVYSLTTSNIAATSDGMGLAGVTSNWTGITGTWPMMLDDKLGSKPFLYVPPNFCLSTFTWFATTYAGGGNATGTMMLEFWVAPGETDTQTVVYTDVFGANPTCGKRQVLSTLVGNWVRPVATSMSLAGAGVLGAAANMYAALAITPVTPGLAAVAGIGPLITTAAGVGGSYALLPVPEAMPQQHILYSLQSLDNVVMHSSHITLENMTKVLNKEGLINAGRVNMVAANPFLSTDVVLTGLDPAKRYFGAAEHGLVSYVDPTAEYGRPRSHRVYYNYKDNSVTQSFLCMQLRQSDCFNYISITDSDVATVGTFGYRVSLAWEFLSTSSLFDLGVTTHKTQALDDAMNQLALRSPFSRFEGQRRQELSPFPQPRLKPKPKAKPQAPPAAKMWYNGGPAAGPPNRNKRKKTKPKTP